MKITPDLQPLARPISHFSPDPRNARVHPEKNLAATMDSLQLYGQRKPVVARRAAGAEHLTVIAGNGTLEAARRLAELLQELQGDGLATVGFEAGEVDALIARLAPPDDCGCDGCSGAL